MRGFLFAAVPCGSLLTSVLSTSAPARNKANTGRPSHENGRRVRTTALAVFGCCASTPRQDFSAQLMQYATEILLQWRTRVWGYLSLDERCEDGGKSFFFILVRWPTSECPIRSSALHLTVFPLLTRPIVFRVGELLDTSVQWLYYSVIDCVLSTRRPQPHAVPQISSFTLFLSLSLSLASRHAQSRLVPLLSCE